MIIPMQYTHTGYDYLDRVNSYQTHSGVDLNYGRPYEDLGKPVRAIAKGKVVFAKNTGKGWGNLIVVYHNEYKIWSRVAHLYKMRVEEGQEVDEGFIIGECGATGGNWAPHVHFDIIKKQLSSWTAYTNFWSLDKVREYYADPLKFIAHIQEREAVVPDIKAWHKNNKIIANWEEAPPEWKTVLAWGLYKMGKALAEGRLKKDDFNL